MKLALLGALLGAAISTSVPAISTSAAPRPKMSVKKDGLSLDVEGALRFEEGPTGRRAWLLEAHASEPLVEAASYIHEDGFADVRLDHADARHFTVVVREGHELSTLLTGQRLFLHLVTEDGSQKNAMVRFDTAFRRFDGDRSIYVEQAIRPVYVEDGVTNLRFRARVQSALPVQVTNDDDTEPTMTALGDGRWLADWEPGPFFIAADHDDPVVWRTATGRKITAISFFVAELGLTDGAAEVAWPQTDETCDDAVRACVLTTQDDHGACGTYRAVNRCVQTLDAEDPYPPCSVDADCRRPNQACGIDGLCFFTTEEVSTEE